MKYILLIVTVVIGMLFLFWKDVSDLVPVQKLSGENSSSAKQRSITSNIDVLQKWDLPDRLKEVSGIAYLDEQRFAAVQDEAGSIFIYNRISKKIEKEISFGGAGDYEGLAVKGNIAYIVTGGGSIYEVDMSSQPAKVKEYSTTLTSRNNVEGLCYDAANKRLLLTVKDRDPNSSEYKGIYAFDLTTKKFSGTPVYKISLSDAVFRSGKKNKAIMPASIGIHPASKNIFITDGPNARLLILDANGSILKLIDLGKQFAQPEGITFSPAGGIYISNEGNKDPGNIIEVRVTQ